MSPTVRLEPLTDDLDRVHRPGTPRAAVAYACLLLASALAVVLSLVVAGSAWPPLEALLLLVLPLALCMKRFVLLPNETGVMADAAVIFAAIVAFQHEAPWLGPLVVALLVGLLDVKLWGERAFIRMAYNSGSTTLVAAVGLVMFDVLCGTFGSSMPAVLAAAALAAIPYVFAETAFGVGLVSLLGERPTIALRLQLSLNAVAFPLAVVGAVVGLTAVDLGWWTFLVLLPAPLVPELLVVVLPRRLGTRRALAIAPALAAAALVLVSATSSSSTAGALTGFAALVCLVLLENPPTRAAPVPVLASLLIVAPIARYADASPFAATVVAVVAGTVYLAVAARGQPRAAWSLPVVAFAAPLAGAVDLSMFCASAAIGLVLCAMWGPLPWTSRYVGPFADGHRRFPRRPLLVALATATIVFVLVERAGLIAVAIVELEVAMAALAVRLWRFAPRRRTRDVCALVLVAVAGLVSLTHDGPLGRYMVVASFAGVVGIAWPLAIDVPRAEASEELDVTHRQ